MWSRRVDFEYEKDPDRDLLLPAAKVAELEQGKDIPDGQFAPISTTHAYRRLAYSCETPLD